MNHLGIQKSPPIQTNNLWQPLKLTKIIHGHPIKQKIIHGHPIKQ